MQLEVGQSIIAHVEIENELQWILSEIKQCFPERNEYQIMDLLPEEGAQPIIVAASEIRKYPQQLQRISPGQRLLCIWYDGNQWLSVLYPCQALEAYDGGSGEMMVLKVKFEGVAQVQYVHASWLASVE